MASTRKKKSAKRSKQKQSKGFIGRCISLSFWLLVLTPVAIVVLYFFGSVETRTEIENRASDALYTLRDSELTPDPAADLLARIEDQVPDTESFVVDAEEAGRDGSHFIAGIPRATTQLTLARKSATSTLYDQGKRALCIAARITADDESTYPVQWNHETWKHLIDELSKDYPSRFEEVWLYSGPVYPNKAAKHPTAFYAIAFDITEDGGLRAISFLVPANAKGNNLSAYLSSIQAIESQSDLNFLPQLEPDSRQLLSQWTEARVW